MKFATVLALSSLGIAGLSMPVFAQKPDGAPKLVLTAAPMRSSSSVWDGVYTAGQADRGALIASRCASCHGPDLKGDIGPSLIGAGFASRWNGWTLGDMTERILSEVRALASHYADEDKDAGDPALLGRQQSADVLAYLLLVNRFPGGTTELPVSQAFLSQIHFQASNPLLIAEKTTNTKSKHRH
jgi:hypothetical protein